MSLQTDIVFVKALQENAELMAELPAGDVYNTSIPLPDIELINAPVPYVIVSFDGLQNSSSTKDMDYDGDTDTVQIGIEIAASTRPQLASIAEQVRASVRSYFENYDGDDDEILSLIPTDYTFTADAVGYDADKPCFWQRLHYQCDTEP